MTIWKILPILSKLALKKKILFGTVTHACILRPEYTHSQLNFPKKLDDQSKGMKYNFHE